VLPGAGTRRWGKKKVNPELAVGGKLDPSERATGTRDEHYDLISVLYHALHGAETAGVYAVDAEATGDERLAAFFREAQGVHVGAAEQAKGLLGILEGAPEEGSYSAGTESAGGGIPTGDVPPRTAQSGWETPPPGPRRASPAEASSRDQDITPEGERVPPDAPAQGEDMAPPVGTPRRAVTPDAPRTQEPPPRSGDAPPSPSEQPPR
jgi:hypothetical protein